MGCDYLLPFMWHITPFIDHLIDVGVDVLNPIQPECMEFDEIYDQFGDRLSFWGTLGTQQLLPFGTADEVKNTTICRLKKYGNNGRRKEYEAQNL